MLVSYRPLARDSSVGDRRVGKAADVVGTNQRRKSDRRAKRGCRRRPSRPELRVSRREERPVNKAGYASVGDTIWLKRNKKTSTSKQACCRGRLDTAHSMQSSDVQTKSGAKRPRQYTTTSTLNNQATRPLVATNSQSLKQKNISDGGNCL